MQLSDRIGRHMKLHDLHVLMAVVQTGSPPRIATSTCTLYWTSSNPAEVAAARDPEGRVSSAAIATTIHDTGVSAGDEGSVVVDLPFRCPKPDCDQPLRKRSATSSTSASLSGVVPAATSLISMAAKNSWKR